MKEVIKIINYFDERFYQIELNEKFFKDENNYKHLPKSYVDPPFVYLPSYNTIYNTFIPSWLPKWRGSIGNLQADLVSAIAKKKGSDIHNYIQQLSIGKIAVYNPLDDKEINDQINQYNLNNEIDFKDLFYITEQEHMVQLARFENLINTLNAKIKETETIVFNIKEGYAGTADALWELQGGEYFINGKTIKTKIETGLYLVDYKTGETMDETSVLCQLASYINAHKLKNKIKGGIAIHLNANSKNGIEGVKVIVKSKKELKVYFERFKNIKKVYYDNNEYIEPKKYQIPNIIKL